MATREELEQKINKLEVNMNRTDRIVNGGEDEDVLIDGGQLVPSIRKWQKELGEEYGFPQDAIDQANDAANRAEGAAAQAQESAAEVVVLRSDLADPDKGAAMVAYEGGSVADKLDHISDDISKHTGVLDISELGLSGDITNAVVAINMNPAITSVYVPSGSYTSSAGLQRDVYGGGSIIYRQNDIAGGKRNSLADGVALGSAALQRCEAFGLQPTQRCAFGRLGDRFYAYRHLGGSYWLEMQYLAGDDDSAGNPVRWNWYDTWVRQFTEVYLRDDPDFVKSGTFTDLQSTDPNPYVGHTSTRSQTVGGTIEIEVDGGGDYYVTVVGQPYGNYMKVEIDGAFDLVNALPNDAGYPYIDCYSPTEPTYRMRFLIARNVPEGQHTVRLTHMADANPAKNPSLDRMWFNAFERAGATAGTPWKGASRPTAWAEGVTVGPYAEVIGPTGQFYVTTGGGTTGTNPPIHTSGTVSDGGVSWVRISTSAFGSKRTRLQPTPAQVDYAYEFAPNPESPKQDVGGNAHGNEYLLETPELYVDGIKVDIPGQDQWVEGLDIRFVQRVQAYYGTPEDHININETRLTYQIDQRGKTIRHSQLWQSEGVVGYFYPAMWTLYRYAGGNERYNVFDECYRPIGGLLDLQQFLSQPTNPIIGGTRDVYAELRGQIFRPIGSENNPVDGEMSIRAGLLVTPDSVNHYRNTDFSFGIAANNSNFDGSNQYAAWTAKMYFQRCSTNDWASESVSVGAIWESESRYVVSIGAV